MERGIKKFKIKTNEGYYALLCDDQKWGNPIFSPLICGVYASHREARLAAKEIKDCLCSHTIKKVTLTIEYNSEIIAKRNAKKAK